MLALGLTADREVVIRHGFHRLYVRRRPELPGVVVIHGSGAFSVQGRPADVPVHLAIGGPVVAVRCGGEVLTVNVSKSRRDPLKVFLHGPRTFGIKLRKGAHP